MGKVNCNSKRDDQCKDTKEMLGLPAGSGVKNNAGDETQVQSLGQEHPLEKKTATHSSVWRIPWTEEPGRLQAIGLHRVRHDWLNNVKVNFVQRYKEGKEIQLCGCLGWGVFQAEETTKRNPKAGMCLVCPKNNAEARAAEVELERMRRRRWSWSSNRGLDLVRTLVFTQNGVGRHWKGWAEWCNLT